MEAVVDKLLTSVDWVQLIAKIAAGGWPAWIATAVLLLLGLGGFFWWQRFKAGLAWRESQRQAAEQAAKNAEEARRMEEQHRAGRDAVDELRKKEPDAGKQPRPPVIP